MDLTVPQAPERSSPVILSAAKDLAAHRARPFAALKVTLLGSFVLRKGKSTLLQLERRPFP